MIHLKSISLDRDRIDNARVFPFAVPAIRELDRLEFATPVALLAGENGSGKSTLLEALARAAESVAVGSDSIERDKSLDHVKPLGQALRLSWTKRTRRGFFLRAEDFFGYVKRTRQEVLEFQAQAERVRSENPDLAEGELARINAPYAGSARALTSRYGEDIDARSHGEQFLAFFQARLVPGGLYLLDEPEAPLSPMRQLALLSAIRAAADEQECQFIIATHSPILMALPGATILSFDETPIRPIAYEDLEHVTLMRDFLNRPESFLKHL